MQVDFTKVIKMCFAVVGLRMERVKKKGKEKLHFNFESILAELLLMTMFGTTPWRL